MLWPIEKLIGHRFDDFAPLARIADVECPVLVVHGDADKVIPVKDAFRLFEAVPDGQILIVPGGGHTSLEPFEPHMPQMIAFLEKYLAV